MFVKINSAQPAETKRTIVANGKNNAVQNQKLLCKCHTDQKYLDIIVGRVFKRLAIGFFSF